MIQVVLQAGASKRSRNQNPRSAALYRPPYLFCSEPDSEKQESRFFTLNDGQRQRRSMTVPPLGRNNSNVSSTPSEPMDIPGARSNNGGDSSNAIDEEEEVGRFVFPRVRSETMMGWSVFFFLCSKIKCRPRPKLSTQRTTGEA